MPMLLDMKTIFITLVAGHVFTLILISAYWRQHKKDKTFNVFFGAKCLQAIAWLLLTLRGGIPDILTISVANSLLFLGTSLETVSILKLLNSFKRMTKRVYLVLTVVNLVGFHLIILIENQENLRIAFASFGTASLVLIPAFRMILEKSASLLKKIMGYFYLLVIISLLLRGVGALFNHSMGLFTPGVNQTFAFLSLYLVMILGNMGFVLLLKERTDEELIRIASYDDLTNTLNRRSFMMEAEKAISLCAKQKKAVTLLLFDIDKFKQINDKFGHNGGDLVLQDLAARIQNKLHAGELFGRYGGDEFAILLPYLDVTSSNRLAESIRRSIEETNSKEIPVRYTISMGLLTVVPDKNTKLDSLYITCDLALYEAKRRGRNRVYREQA